MEIEEMIIICAVRYALGRMSYVVDEVCKYVASKRDKLSRNCINVITRDIKEEMQRYHDLGEKLGMECDERSWVKLLEVLERKV